MVKGFDTFKNWFAEYIDCFTIIGGTACDLLMTEIGVDFRATKDIDLVLMIETMSPTFGKHFWAYIKQAGYENRHKSCGTEQYYRFSHPKQNDYPSMIELFSRKPDKVFLPAGSIITPINMGNDVSSLSAILLDDSYYQLLRSGRYFSDGMPILGAPYIILFKMRAWLDLHQKQRIGELVRNADIKKHRNDVFRLSELLTESTRIELPEGIFRDVEDFINLMQSEDVNLKDLGLRRDKEDILHRLKKAYC